MGCDYYNHSKAWPLASGMEWNSSAEEVKTVGLVSGRGSWDGWSLEALNSEHLTHTFHQ